MKQRWVYVAGTLATMTCGAQARDHDDVLLRRLSSLEAEVTKLKAALAKRGSPHLVKRVPAHLTTGATLSPKQGGSADQVPDQTPVSARALADTLAGPYFVAFGGVSRGVGNDGGAAAAFGLNPTTLSPDEAGLAVGFNVVSGRMMYGLESAWRYDFSGSRSNTLFSADAIVNAGLPQPTNSHTLGPISLPQLGHCPAAADNCFVYYPGPTPSSLTLADLATDRLVIAERGSGELVGRIGALYGDWMPYFRLGAGASLFTEQRLTTASTLRCDQPNITFSDFSAFYGGYLNKTIQSCGSTTTVTSSSTSSTTAWLPYFVLGIGLEANLGRYFARAEANASEYVGTTNGLGIVNAFARYDGRLGVGLRF